MTECEMSTCKIMGELVIDTEFETKHVHSTFLVVRRQKACTEVLVNPN